MSYNSCDKLCCQWNWLIPWSAAGHARVSTAPITCPWINNQFLASEHIWAHHHCHLSTAAARLWIGIVLTACIHYGTEICFSLCTYVRKTGIANICGIWIRMWWLLGTTSTERGALLPSTGWMPWTIHTGRNQRWTLLEFYCPGKAYWLISEAARCRCSHTWGRGNGEINVYVLKKWWDA